MSDDYKKFRNAIFRHNGFLGGTTRAYGLMSSIQKSPTATDEAKELAGIIQQKLILLEFRLAQRDPQFEAARLAASRQSRPSSKALAKPGELHYTSNTGPNTGDV